MAETCACLIVLMFFSIGITSGRLYLDSGRCFLFVCRLSISLILLNSACVLSRHGLYAIYALLVYI